MQKPDPRKMSEIVRGVVGNKSEMIRRLVNAGYRQADVARFLDIRDQFVSNVVRKAKQQEVSGERHPALPSRIKLSVDPSGRVVIPVEFRREMEIREVDELLARLVDGELRLISPAMAVKRAQKMLRELLPADSDLAGSLIADRRREAARESDNG